MIYPLPIFCDSALAASEDPAAERAQSNGLEQWLFSTPLFWINHQDVLLHTMRGGKIMHIQWEAIYVSVSQSSSCEYLLFTAAWKNIELDKGF